jgi:hypothetical protein
MINISHIFKILIDGDGFDFVAKCFAHPTEEIFDTHNYFTIFILKFLFKNK